MAGLNLFLNFHWYPRMSDALKVLIIEDDADVALGCKQALFLEGISAECAPSAESARRKLDLSVHGVVVSDVRLPGQDGMVFLRALLKIDAELPVVLITGHGDISMAVQAMKDGAYDFLQKPFAPERLVDTVRRALEKRRLVLEVRALRQRLEQRNAIEAVLIGNAPALLKVHTLIGTLADSMVNVLIHGETGTGKELVALCLHDTSSRRRGNFVAINCGGMPENLLDSELFGHEAGAYTGAAKRRMGKLEYANGGTLFLDEIETMPIQMQIKLLRVLQERTLERLGSNTAIPIDCRIVSATKEDLLDLAVKDRFRTDLYYRLNVATIPLPPLRERREDILLLFEHFLLSASARYERSVPALSSSRMQLLVGYSWPGNIRELRNVADRCALGIEAGAPPFGQAESNQPQSLANAVEAFERALIADTLKRHGSLTKSAEVLKVAKTTLHDKIKKYGLETGTSDLR